MFEVMKKTELYWSEEARTDSLRILKFGMGKAPFNSRQWAIVIYIRSEPDERGYRYHISSYGEKYTHAGEFEGFLGGEYSFDIEDWPHGIEELKALAIFEWRTRGSR
jgi:hypothetical protein